MKIALILNEMSIGGIPRASIPLMQQLSKFADVTLILSSLNGEFNNLIPSGVEIKVLPYRRTKYVFNSYISTRKIFKAIIFLLYSTLLGKILNRWVKNNAYIARHLGYILEERYDCAIAYHGMNIDHLTRTLYNINAKKKVAWIHGDHPFTSKHLDDVKVIYSEFDKIYFDSDICKNKFKRDFPDLGVEMETCYCLLDTDEIINKSNLDVKVEYENNHINILTVGRLSPEKGQDMIPSIIRILNRQDIRWYLVGDGPDRERIESLKKEYGTDQLIFLGARTNPYPYLKECDIYVQPSYSEAYSLTAFEAATFARPIVITNVAGATELLVNDYDALVVDPSPQSIANAISRLIEDTSLKFKLSHNIKNRDFSNYAEVEKVINWLNN